MKLYQQRIHTLKEAYKAIHDFFSCYHVHEALEEVDRLYAWAAKEKYYKKTAPGDIIFCVQQLHSLFTAVEIINYSTGRKTSPFLFHQTTATLTPAHYLKDSPHCTAWECYPRHLTAEEYLNPYWALEKLHGIPDWEEVLQELMEAALSNGSIEGSYTIGEVIKWRESMMGIVEGGWLVERRVESRS
ncbi:hypothetical protein [Ferruginibacter sp. HRS2-29]|uniref:hypothetical protein n=1 Tax=Ferruginibacter sp. HRS2-29 TaxID=2487334 RepID=UPI0020CD49DE|nr:hypothetical protein [Ferruginibacter sp. HRS2-29]MCP9752838.1 hypothetical protein [Ferruginibacter sp. HRS2-29]